MVAVLTSNSPSSAHPPTGIEIQSEGRGAADSKPPKMTETEQQAPSASTSLGASLTAPPDSSHDVGFLSPLAAAEGNHLSPYAHLSEYPSDSAYDNFSDYETPGFGDDSSDLAINNSILLLDEQQDEETVADTCHPDPTTESTSKERISSLGDSITHPSTRLLSPVPSNPSVSRASTALDITNQSVIDPNSTSSSPSYHPVTMAKPISADSAGPPESVVHLDEPHEDIQTVSQATSQQSTRGSTLPSSSDAPNNLVPTIPNDSPHRTPAPMGRSVRNLNDTSTEPNRVRRGIDPAERNRMNETVMPTLDEQQKERELATAKADVAAWLRSTDADQMENRPASGPGIKESVVGSAELQPVIDKSAHGIASRVAPAPGPGVYVNQDDDEDGDASNDEASSESDDEATPPATFSPHDSFPTPSDTSAVQTAPWARKPWTDVPFDPESASLRGQPASSNAAIARFERRARDTETASVTATIASSFRRRSLESMFSAANISVVPPSEADSSFTSRAPAFTDHRASLLERILPRRGNSNVRKRKESKEAEQKPSEDHVAKDNRGNMSSIQRMPSWARPKSPSLSAISPQTSPTHSQQPKSATTLTPPSGAWSSVTNVIRRARSRSDIGHTSALAEQWASTGGPPVANLRPPSQEVKPKALLNLTTSLERRDRKLDREGDGDQTPPGPVDMAMAPLDSPAAPTHESFKVHALEANPAIESYMLERVTVEQLKRYRRLVEARLMHSTQVQRMECESKDYCGSLGTGPRMLEPRKAGPEPDSAAVTFFIHRPGSPNESSAVGDDESQPASFPEGIPLPPPGVQRLPAEFECPLCFEIKKIFKPSDWTKHVHEDLQPFTCSFPECVEPKSFKRKADWVRHENERHRQLEKWICNFQDCQHVCYRKDNFVQHLVREHKLPEPKIRAAKGSSGAQDQSEVARLAEQCRYDTTRRPDEEPCRFCGNYLTSWKKLSAHLAKHMEHVSLPILSLAHQVELNNTAVLSPADQEPRSPRHDFPGATPTRVRQDQTTLTKEFGNFESVNAARGLQAQPHARTPSPNTATTFQNGGSHSPGFAYRPSSQHGGQGMPQLVTQSYPGAHNFQRCPTHLDDPFLTQPIQFVEEHGYADTSPSETFSSAFDNPRNILPGSQSHGTSSSYPPAFMATSSNQQPSNDAFAQGATLYSDNQLYDSRFAVAEYNMQANPLDQQTYRYDSAMDQTANMQYSQEFPTHTSSRDSSHTPSVQFSPMTSVHYPESSQASVGQYSYTATAAFSTSSSPFPPHTLNHYAPTQLEQQHAGGVQQQYVAPAPSANDGYFTSNAGYGGQTSTAGQNGVDFNQQQQYQRQGHGAFYGS